MTGAAISTPRPGLARRRALAGLAGLAGLAAVAGSRLTLAQAQPVAQGESLAPPPPQVGSLLALPDMVLLDGSRFRAAEADGQVLLLYWWASWCPFCAEQTPWMEKLWQAERGRGLRMLGLSIDRSADDAGNYLRKKGYTFPAGLVTPAVARILPKPKGLPVTVVRGRHGRVLTAQVGQLFPEDVEQLARFV